MRSLKILAAVLLCASAPALATVTINVTTNVDEFNSRTTNGSGESYPLSQGCSLREAMQNVAAGNNTQFPECTPAPETGAAAVNIIDLTGAGGPIIVNSQVPDPTDITGAAKTYNGLLPFVSDMTSVGKLTVENGAMQCFTDPVSNDGVRLFTLVNGDLTLSAMAFTSCSAQVPGVVVNDNSGGSNLSLKNNVTITGILSTAGGTGGCVNMGGGNVNISETNFTGCVIDSSSNVAPATTYLPGFGPGNGGALAIGNVGFSTAASLANVTFTSNVAGTSGGAIYLSGTDAISMTNVTFTTNVANGNTHDSSPANAELGGGAIFASNTATGGHTLPNVPSAFLILNAAFTGNLAPFGTGGGILLTGGGQITYGTALPGDGSGFPTNIPGGIVASNFIGNIASGTWDAVANNPSNRAGSGGAIYASGVVSILDASFVGGNSSAAASGGAIAVYGSSAQATVSNSTFNGNSANVDGGAIAIIRDPADNVNGTAVLTNVTIDSNTAGASNGGGIFNVGADTDMVIKNSILSNNTTGGNCSGPVTDSVGNLQFNPDTGCGTMKVGDPQLSSPTPVGGLNAPAVVMKLSDTSAANGNGDPATCTAAPIYNLDEALNSRPQGKPNCDSGAYEASSLTPVTLQSFDVE